MEENIKLTHELLDMAKKAQWAAVRDALAKKPDVVNIRPHSRSFALLHFACYQVGYSEVEWLLTEFGADPNLKTKDGQTSLQILQQALKDSPGKTAGDRAKDNACLSLLQSHSAARTTSVDQLLNLAEERNWREVRSYLDGRRDLVNVRLDDSDFGLLHFACNQLALEEIDWLVTEAGADPKLQTKGGKTAFQVLEQALEHPGTTEWDKENGKACLSWLQSRFTGSGSGDTGYVTVTNDPCIEDSRLGLAHETVRERLSTKRAHAPVDMKLVHELLNLAKEIKWAEVRPALVNRPELVNIRPDSRNFGFLHFACWQISHSEIEWLVAIAGADPKLPSRDGKTAVQVLQEALLLDPGKTAADKTRDEACLAQLQRCAAGGSWAKC